MFTISTEQVLQVRTGALNCCMTKLTPSFPLAGFYYVCVDFNPPTNAASARPSASQRGIVPPTPEDVDLEPSAPSRSPKPDAAHCRSRRDSSMQAGGRSPSSGPRTTPPTASMNGFYFHQNS